MAHNYVIDKFKDELIAIIKKHIPECSIYLFGSRARKTHQEGADVDLAIKGTDKIDFSRISKVMTDIEDTNIPVYVDVIDMNNVSDSMLEEIEKDGVLWTH